MIIHHLFITDLERSTMKGNIFSLVCLVLNPPLPVPFRRPGSGIVKVFTRYLTLKNKANRNFSQTTMRKLEYEIFDLPKSFPNFPQDEISLIKVKLQ